MPSMNPTNNFGAFNFIVDPVAGKGTHQTISTATAAASSGANIFIRPGTYTENFVPKAGVNYIAVPGDSQAQGLVNIVGTITINDTTGTGKVVFSGISFNNPAGAIVNMPGTVLLEAIFDNCYFLSNRTTGGNSINCTNSNAATSYKFRNCLFDNTTSSTMFSSTNGRHFFNDCRLLNSFGLTSTYFYVQGTSTCFVIGCEVWAELVSDVSGTLNVYYCIFNTATISSRCLNMNGNSTCYIVDCFFSVGNNAAIQIGTNSITNMSGGFVECSGTTVNVVNGSGTLNYSPFGFSPGTSNNISVTTTNLRKFGSRIWTNGLTFDNTNILSNYSEGTFTPTVIGDGTAGTATYSLQIGRYTRIGNRCTVNILVQWTGHTGTGNMRVSGLPFVSKNVTNVSNWASGYFDNGATMSSLMYFSPSNTSYLSAFIPGTAFNLQTIIAAGQIRLTFDYEVN